MKRSVPLFLPAALVATIGILAGCTNGLVTTPDIANPSLTPPGIVETTPVASTETSVPLGYLASIGPESIMPDMPYPESISLPLVTYMLAYPEPPIEPEMASSPEFVEIVKQQSLRAMEAGVNVIDPNAADFRSVRPHMLSNGINWTVTVDKPDGTLGAWLKLKDSASQTGIRYAIQPTWDPMLSKGYEVAGFGLPELTNAANHYDVIDLAGYAIMVEVNPDGVPVNWFDYKSQTHVSFTDKDPTVEATVEQSSASWSLEIPATPEECTNVIRSDTFEHTEADIASLNAKIMEQKWYPDLPAGEFPPRTQQINLMPWVAPPPDVSDIIPYSLTRIDMWYNYYESYGKFMGAVVTSCSKYKDGYMFGVFIDVRQEMVPVQVFVDPEILQGYLIDYHNGGYDDRSFENRLLEDYQVQKDNPDIAWNSKINLFGEFDRYTKFAASDTGALGSYLENTYDYSERIRRLFTGLADETEAQETIALMQRIPLPGYVRLW